MNTLIFFFKCYGYLLDLPVRTHSFPTRRSSDLISAFQAYTAADFESTLKRLQAGSGDRLRGLVLDLRSNPGGLLTTAVQIADDLLEEGGIVSTRGRSPL